MSASQPDAAPPTAVLKKNVKRWTKKVLRPVTCRWQTQARLVADLRRLGVKPDGCLLVHSSLSSLGFVIGGPTTVVGALQDAVGPHGTLVLPSHSWFWMNKGCRQFDVRTTLTCVGILPEVFRQLPGVVRSLHPTHAIAATGPMSESLIEGHERAETPCGSGSPYERLVQDGGQILFVGTDLASNTLFHTVEAFADCPYLLIDEPQEFAITDQAGNEQTISFLIHRPLIPRRFAEMKDMLVQSGVIREGRVGAAPSMLVCARGLFDVMLPLLHEDPDYLLAESNG